MEEIKENLQNIEEVEKTEIETREGKLEIKVNFRVMKNVEKKLGIKFMEAIGKINNNHNESIQKENAMDIVFNFDTVFLYEVLFETQEKYNDIESFIEVLAINKSGSYIGAINTAVGKLMTL